MCRIDRLLNVRSGGPPPRDARRHHHDVADRVEQPDPSQHWHHHIKPIIEHEERQQTDPVGEKGALFEP